MVLVYNLALGGLIRMTTKEILKMTNDLHLLYIEDDLTMHETSIDLFKNFFNQITTAIDGVDALEKYKEGSIDIIITDISMPRMDGIELIKKIRKENRHIPIIVYSAWNDPSYMTACISMNVDGYLLKPMQIKNIMEVLEKVSIRLLHFPKVRKKSELIEALDKQNNELLKEQFAMDELTGLKSYNYLLKKIEKCSLEDIPVIILIDIDEFHIFNELYGLSVGDEILFRFVNNLKKFCKEHPYELFRMSGDQFVLYENVKAIDTEKYEGDIEELFKSVANANIDIENIKEPITLSITIGVSFSQDNSYGKANMALNEARKRGRTYLGFNTEADIREELRKNLYWREEINLALSQNRVCTFYHSIVDRDKNIIKYESLIRIKQPQNDGSTKIIIPHDFLDFSKISKQYVGLTTVMIKESFKTMIEHNVHVAINLTFQDIENRDIYRLLIDNISKHNLANKTKFDISSQVIFELLEYHNNTDYDKFISFVDEFKALGVLITIDNFGLGFSNISKISAIAPHYVKIDSTLMRNVDTDKHAYSLVKAIVKFAKELGIKTIAEHVTTKEIFEKSIELGIDEFQGYHFGKPAEFITL